MFEGLPSLKELKGLLLKSGSGKPAAVATRKTPTLGQTQAPRKQGAVAPVTRPAQGAKQAPVRKPAVTQKIAPGEFGAVAPAVAQPTKAKAPVAVVARRELATEEQVNEFLNWEGDVLTATESIIKTTEEQRQLCVFLSNGAFLVAKDDPVNPHIMEVKYNLRQAKQQIKAEYLVDLDVIRKVYEAFDRRTGGLKRSGVNTEMQMEVLKLISEAASRRCSDIHVIVGRHEAEIRVRCDGVMQPLRQVRAAFARDLCSTAFVMADASDTAYRPYDYQGARISNINTPLPEGVQAIRLQFNPLPNGGRYMVARLLYAASQADAKGEIDALGYGRTHVEQIKRMRERPFGINIFSGPTGSGKSTTLQRALSAVIREKRGTVNVITIEDPPEYVISGAAQLPVTNAQTDEERSEKFRQAITASLRSDPDVIMIGEIRDRASSALAFSAAMTGHQVWASLHANDALSILDRFRDHHVEDYKLSDHTLVTGLVGQRLVRRLCEHCKIPFAKAHAAGIIDPDLAKQVIRVAGDRINQVFVGNDSGCSKCIHGFSGRTVIAECIVPDQTFMSFVRKTDKNGALQYWLEHLDGLTMLEHAIQKMVTGQVDPREVKDKAGVLSDFNVERAELVFGKLFG